MSDLESSTSKIPLDVAERRRSVRRPPLYSQATVWIGLKQRINARVIDESDGGVGLHLPAGHHHLEFGLKVRVEQGGTRRWATIRHISDNENGCLKVGLSWDI